MKSFMVPFSVCSVLSGPPRNLHWIKLRSQHRRKQVSPFHSGHPFPLIWAAGRERFHTFASAISRTQSGSISSAQGGRGLIWAVGADKVRVKFLLEKNWLHNVSNNLTFTFSYCKILIKELPIPRTSCLCLFTIPFLDSYHAWVKGITNFYLQFSHTAFKLLLYCKSIASDLSALYLLYDSVVKSCWFMLPCTCASGWGRIQVCILFEQTTEKDVLLLSLLSQREGQTGWVLHIPHRRENHGWPQSDVPCSYTNICVARECAGQVVKPGPFIKAWWRISNSWSDPSYDRQCTAVLLHLHVMCIYTQMEVY